jgi:hypothetical protein
VTDLPRPRHVVSIGPPKCGTTGLFHALAASALTAAPTLKEPRFFSRSDGSLFGDLPDALVPRGHRDRGAEWYDGLFSGSAASAIRLDFTTYYSVLPDTPEVLAEWDPDPRMIMLVRDPVKRFVSNYQQYDRMGIRLPSLEEAATGDGAVSRLLYAFGDYAGTYQRFAEVFGDERIFVLDVADLRPEATDVWDRLGVFTGIEDLAYDVTERERNPAGSARFPLLQRVMYSDGLRTATKRLSPGLTTLGLRMRRKVVKANTAVATAHRAGVDPVIEAHIRARLAPQDAWLAEWRAA